MPRPRTLTVEHAAVIPVVEHIPPRVFLAFGIAHGQVDGVDYSISGSMGASHLILEIGGRQFSIDASAAVRSVHDATRKPGRKKARSSDGGVT